MSDERGAAFVDLDRTLIRSASGPVLHEAMEAGGVLSPGRHLPGDRLIYGVYNRLGESVASMALARAAARLMRGRPVEATRLAAKRAVAPLIDLVQPYAVQVLDAHRRDGLPIVLATTSPYDLVSPLAEALGFDGVIATRYGDDDGRYTGSIEGSFVWGSGKRAAVGQWAADHGVRLSDSHAYSDSFFDLPLLNAVGHPHPVNPDPRLVAVALARRWPLEYWDRLPGVPSIIGLEPYHLARPFFRPAAFPYARFDISGVENVPEHGPVILASNHRSYFDVAAIGLVVAQVGRPVRFLAKQEIFDAPLVGQLARALGGIPVDRGVDGSTPMSRAEAALAAGEVVIVLPQGTIPRGSAFFQPILTGKTGAARLAADTGAPVIPIGLWGTEAVWPRSQRIPLVTQLLHPPRVRVVVGPPVPLGLEDAEADTRTLMAAIVDLLPDEARTVRAPSEEELADTLPPA
jgi:putative phosphoserine phosphatase / 1-acylglycerol-3-phosphate O-acyltransferase